MDFDAALWVDDLRDVPASARAAEAAGFGTLWTSEIKGNPLFPLVLAAEHTERVRLGTAILVSFARSPMDTAYQAWDMARFSRGRFALGLGTQVRPHITRRFGMPWPDAPASAQRDYIAAMRAVWHAWQTGERLNHRGPYYKLTLMAPFFDPGPHDFPYIPIWTAGVNPGMCRLAGEVSDGLHAHPFHTRRYLTEVVLPAVAEGVTKTGRDAGDVAVSATVFVAAGETQDEIDAAVEAVRGQIAFYASTPAYRRVMDLHGWGADRELMGRLAARQRWDELATTVSDEMVDTVAIVGRWAEVPAKLRARYEGVLDRVTLYERFDPDSDTVPWADLCAALASSHR